MSETDWLHVEQLLRSIGSFVFAMYVVKRLFDVYLASQHARLVRDTTVRR